MDEIIKECAMVLSALLRRTEAARVEISASEMVTARELASTGDVLFERTPDGGLTFSWRERKKTPVVTNTDLADRIERLAERV